MPRISASCHFCSLDDCGQVPLSPRPPCKMGGTFIPPLWLLGEVNELFHAERLEQSWACSRFHVNVWYNPCCSPCFSLLVLL